MQKLEENQTPLSSRNRMFSKWNKFLTEFARQKPFIKEYTSEGVWLVPEGDKLRINYSGLLAKSGAKDVYTIAGYGSNNYWENVRYYHMDKIGDKSFQVLIPSNEKSNINICFKDGGENWDNNIGKNYTFDLL